MHLVLNKTGFNIWFSRLSAVRHFTRMWRNNGHGFPAFLSPDSIYSLLNPLLYFPLLDHLHPSAYKHAWLKFVWLKVSLYIIIYRLYQNNYVNNINMATPKKVKIKKILNKKKSKPFGVFLLCYRLTTFNNEHVFFTLRFFSFFQGVESISDYSISFHYIKPESMYSLEFFTYHLRPYGIKMGDQVLNQHVALYKENPTNVTEAKKSSWRHTWTNDRFEHMSDFFFFVNSIFKYYEAEG